MIFMLMLSGAEHKYIIQVDQHKIINVLPHNIVHQPLKSWWGITKSKMIGAPHGLQDGLIQPLAKYSSTYLLSSADSASDTLYWCL